MYNKFEKGSLYKVTRKKSNQCYAYSETNVTSEVKVLDQNIFYLIFLEKVFDLYCCYSFLYKSKIIFIYGDSVLFDNELTQIEKLT